MNHPWVTAKVLAAVAALVVSAGGVAAAPVPTAGAVVPRSSSARDGEPSAMDACEAGKAPSTTQTVFLSGTNGHASYPRGVDPDNGVFPGDVVSVEISGRLRYDASHWTGPAGTGTPDADGIRPYAATATWSNRPAGRIGSPVPATDLGGCTAVPTKQGARILYGIADERLADNGGGFTITTRVWQAPGRLTIDRTEVTQGVQNRAGQVALVAKKRTFVRVFFHHQYDGSTTMEGVTGTLRVPGIDVVNPPLVNTSVTSLTGGDDPRTLANSLLFEVPAAALGEGARELVVTVTGPEDRSAWPIVRHVPVEFGPMTRLRVIGVRYSYFNVPQALTDEYRDTQPGLTAQPGWWQARTVESWDPMRRMAENILPLARLSVVDDAAGSADSAWGSASFDCAAAQRPEDGRWYCGGYEDAKRWARKYADTLCPGGGCVVVLLQPESQLFGNESGTCFCRLPNGHQTTAGNDVINIQGEQGEAEQGYTLAHEIGHSLGLLHTWDDPHFKSARHALIRDVIGLRYAPHFELEPQHRVEGGSTYELMTYDRPAWFSVYNYCKAMHHLRGRHPVCHTGWDDPRN